MKEGEAEFFMSELFQDIHTTVTLGARGFLFSFGMIYKRYRATSGEKKNPLVTAVENLTSMIWNY